MKYILLILGFSLAFSPSGICMDDNCCSEEIAIALEERDSSCEDSSCCTHDVKHAGEDEDTDSKNLPQHAQAHQCNSCAITFIIDIPIIIEQLEDPFSSPVNTEVKELLNRYAFSIWNPPNNVV